MKNNPFPASICMAPKDVQGWGLGVEREREREREREAKEGANTIRNTDRILALFAPKLQPYSPPPPSPPHLTLLTVDFDPSRARSKSSVSYRSLII